MTARHESATGSTRGTGRSVLLTAALALVLAGAAACGNGETGGATLGASPTPASAASSAPVSESPSPEPTTATRAPSASPKAVRTTAAAGPIVILSPAEGSGVARSFVVKGRSVSFEGTITWQLLKAGDVVSDGHAQGGSGSSAPYEFTAKAPAAGTYTVRVFEESAKDGSALHEVKRTVVVA